MGVLLVDGDGACHVDVGAGGVQAGVVDVVGATQVDVGVSLVVGDGGGGGA